MNTSELYDAFRQDVVDLAKPYLWSDDEVFRYMNDAYVMFVRLTGGVADFTSDICAVDVTTGEATSTISPAIMRIMSATRRSDNKPVAVINSTDMNKLRSSDYGQAKALVMDNRTGNVNYMVQGLQPNTVRWIMIPEVDDIVDLHVYRKPLSRITGSEQELTDVNEDHHIHLMDWMKHLAYKKPDSDTYNPNASATGKADFEAYCAMVKAEWERYKAKPREVSYGGL